MVARRFTAAEIETLTAAVAAAERGSRAELVVLIVEACDDYWEYPLLWSGAVAALSAALLSIFLPAWPLAAGFGLQAILAILTLALTAWGPVRIALVPAFARRAKADAMARRQFAARFSALPAHEPAVLLFVALAEHAVEILANDAAREKIADATWQAPIATLTGSIRTLGPAIAIARTLAEIGVALQSAFPASVDDENRLQDRPVMLDYRGEIE